MFCTNCGAHIPEDGICPNCSTEPGSNENLQTENENQPIAAQSVNPEEPQPFEAQPGPVKGGTVFYSNCGASIPDVNLCPDCGAGQIPGAACTVQNQPVSVANQPQPPAVITEKTKKAKKPGGIIFCLTNKDDNFIYLFAAVFILLAGFIPKSLYLSLTGGPVPMLVSLLANILQFLIFCGLMVIYSNKDSKVSLKGVGKKILNTVLNTAFIWVLIMALYSLAGYIYYALAGTLTNATANDTKAAIPIFAGFIVLLIVLEICIIAAVMLFYIMQRRGAGVLCAGKLFFRVLHSLLKRPALLFALLIFLSMSLLAGKEAFSVINSSMGLVIPYAFLSLFAGCMIVSLFNAYIVNVFFNAGRTIVERKPAVLEVPSGIKSKIPVFPLAVLVPVIIALIFFNKSTSDPYKTFKKDIQNQIAQADILYETGLDSESAREYSAAYSKILAVRGYVLEAAKILQPSSAYSGAADFLKAAQIDPSNSLVPLFQGNLKYFNRDYAGALTIYKEGMKNPKSHPDFFMSGYMASQKSGDSGAADFLHWLINNEVYTDSWINFSNYKLDKLEPYVTELNELEKQVEPKLAKDYYSYVYKGEHQKAVTLLEDLKTRYPNDPQIYYYLSLVYSEYRNETSNYANSVSNVEAFLKNSASEDNKEDQKQNELYAASVYTMANQNVKAEEIYSKWYKADNKDFETAEKYIYALIEDAKYDDAMTVIKTVEGNGYNSANLVEYHALALLNKGLFADSLKHIAKITEYASKNDETYDRVLYSYSLAASIAIKTEDDLKQLETIKDSILYPYINAMYKWRLKDSGASNVFMLQVLAKNDKLGYAWYCAGINYYEKAVRENTGDFKDAIASYQKSIAIVPDHVETYFALGHCLKKAGLQKEALNAFRKTVDLLPYEDHRTDPYGMTVHAQGVINELLAALPKEGN